MKNLFIYKEATEEDAEIIVINSCTVTNSADYNLKYYISKITKKNPTAKILITGCAVYSIGKELYENDQIFGVFGHSEKENISTLLQKKEKFFEIGNLDFINKEIVSNFTRSRAFIKIQEGCDFRCSYCIIPFVRGHSRSINEELIIEQITKLSNNGFSEFILTGINMGSYGKDTNSSLAKLLKKIFKIKGIKRVRLGSLEPSQIDDEFIDILDNPILERHLHIALQYADDRMLRIMKRRNRVQSTLELFEKLASKGFALGTDYIVGHPGETKEIFNSAYKNLEKFPLTHIHLFRYSPRKGTASSRMQQNVSVVLAKERFKKIEKLISNKNFEFRLKKQELSILIEEFKNGYYVGYDQFFNKIFIKSKLNLIHQWVNINEYEVKDINYATK